MLFQVKSSPDPTGITGDEYQRRVQSEEIPYLMDLQGKGVVTHAWGYVGRAGWLAIFDVETHQQLLGLIYSNPLSPHSSYDVVPVFRGQDWQGFSTG
jgi:muconolactone delta-isomerase